MSLILLSLLSCGAKKPVEQPEPPRSFRVLAINDVYRINGFPESAAGGLARVRALRAQLEADSPELLVTGAGDFFYPSLLSRMYDGAQMIDVLNHLDGDGEAFDERLFLTFGNHEFDKDDCEDAAIVRDRVAESAFRWVSADLSFQACTDETGAEQAPPGGDNLVPSAITEVGGVKVGVFGLILPLEDEVPYIRANAEVVETARATSAALRADGAEVVLAITHQSLEDDLGLLKALEAAGPDLILGGHEHESHIEEAGGRWVLKADADARSAVVATVVVDGGAIQVSHELVALDADGPAADAAAQGVIDGWMAKHQTAFCAEKGMEDGCLDEPLGLTRTDLIAEEVEIRKYETTLGNWVMDTAMASMEDAGAEAAFINAGSLRLNQDIPGGANVTRRHVETLFAFPAGLVLLELTGAELQAVVDHAITDWTGNGRFLQVAGMRFVHDPEAGTATGLSIQREDGWEAVAPDKKYRVVTSGYLAGGGDGYSVLVGKPQLQAGEDLKELVVSGLQAAGEAGIGPILEGRICNTTRAASCRDTLEAAPEPSE